MQKRTFFISFVLFSLLGSSFCFAQPKNDDCVGSYDIGDLLNIKGNFSNYEAKASVVPYDARMCENDTVVERDIWFKFKVTKPQPYVWLEIKGVGKRPFKSPQVGLFQGTCDKLQFINCQRGKQISFENLAIGTYFLQISDFDPYFEDYSGTFSITTISPPVFILNKNQEVIASEGILLDSGKEQNDYKALEKNMIKICAPNANQKIKLTFDYYHIATGDSLIVLDNNKTTFQIFDLKQSVGGTNKVIHSTNNCLSVRLTSDIKEEAEGFKAYWKILESRDIISYQYDINYNPDWLRYWNNNNNLVTAFSGTNCPKGYSAYFESDELHNEVGMSKGMILSNGLVDNIFQVQQDIPVISAANFIGDALLDKLYPPIKTKNACTMFTNYFYAVTQSAQDTIVRKDPVTINYSVGSQQFEGQENQMNHDLIGLWSLKEGDEDKAEFVSRLNDKDTIQLNTVNSHKNWEYYHHNINNKNLNLKGIIGASSIDNRNAFIRMDTMWRIIGDNHHDIRSLDFSVASRGIKDAQTALFISPSRSEGGPNSLLLTSKRNYLFENNCDKEYIDTIVLRRGKASVSPTMYTNFKITNGTAKRNVDFILDIPSMVNFPPMVTEIKVPIKVLSDNIIENDEFFILDWFYWQINLAGHDTLHVHIKENPSINIKTLTGKDTIQLCKGSQGIKLSTTGADKYEWSPAQLFDDANSSKPLVNVTKSQWVYVTGDIGTCKVKDSIYIQYIDPLEDIKLDKTKLCEGDSVRVSIGKSPLIWNFANQSNQIAISSFSIKPTKDGILTLQSKAEKCYWQDAISIEVKPNPSVKLSATPATSIFEGESITLNATANSSAGTFQWQPNISKSSTAQVVNPKAGMYLYKVTFQTDFGCMAMDTLSIKVKANENMDFEIPTIFQPESNNDNAILKYYAKNKKPNIQSVLIYSRWGTLVYSSTDFETGWNGNLPDGTACPSDVYLCTVTYKDEKGALQTRTQDVTLLR
jgi:gliding motility-associated-like protein